MIYGFVLTLRGFRHPEFFDRWLFRSAHLAGILFVASLELLGRYCPLTVWENALRRRLDPTQDYPGSFIAGYIEKLIYYEIDLWIIAIPTVLVAGITLLIFVMRPPKRLRGWFAGS